MAKTLYRVEHSAVDLGNGHPDGVVNHGQFISDDDQLKGVDVDRLIRLGAIRKATAEEREAQELLAEKEAAQRAESEGLGRTPAEVEADVLSESTTGNPLPGAEDLGNPAKPPAKK